ncbi:MAG: ATP-binding protein [Armatimonadota bacterium]
MHFRTGIETTVEQLEHWMELPSEDEHIEFKEAKGSFAFDDAANYCIALANEGGGKLILGVSDSPPRHVVGSRAFRNPQKTQKGLLDSIHLRIFIEEIEHPDGRVVVLHVPSRPIGMPLARNGRFLMRSGESLVGMTSDQIRRIHDEGRPDFSATICEQAEGAELSAAAVQILRDEWRRKSGNVRIDELTDEQLLADLGVVRPDGVTYAAIILLGSEDAVRRHLPCAEIIFEYRSDEYTIRHQDRIEFQRGFLLCHNDIWSAVNRRNDTEHYQDGLWLRDIPVFSESVIREAVLNAVSHRDYRLQGPVFIRQFPRKLEVLSPGGLPEGVTVENIMDRQVARNPLLATVLERCGLIERSGQGVDLMFGNCLREGKALPDYSRTDEHQVFLTLPGEVQDANFVRFLETVDRDRQIGFTTEDLIILDHLKHKRTVPQRLSNRLARLVEAGVVERRGRNQHILSQEYYRFVDERGAYTRVAGLDREKCKLPLLQHIEENQDDGSRMKDLMDVVNHLTRSQVRTLLDDLREDGRIHCVGVTRNARWYPGPDPDSNT